MNYKYITLIFALLFSSITYSQTQVNTAEIEDAAVTESKLSASVNASLDLADSAIQSVHGDGANCGAGNYPLGVDANGAAQSCTADNTGIDESTTVSDTATIDLTETGDDISGIVVANSIGAAQLDAATDASLALADSATQPADIDTFAELDAIVADEALANIAGTPTANQVSLFTDANTIAGNPALTFTDPYLVVGGQSAGSFNFHVANFSGGTIGITENLNGHTAADGLSINYTNGGASIVNAETGQLDLGTDSLIRLSIESDGDIDFNAGDLILDEKAALSSTPAAGKGYFYVKNTVPSTAIFVDDTGSEITLGAGGGASQLTDLTDVGTAAVTNRFALMADGVDYDGRALVEADISDLAHTTDTDTQLSEEQVEDFAGGMVTGNTETRIAVTYDDAGNSLDFIVDDMNQTECATAACDLDASTTIGGLTVSTGAHTTDTNTQLTEEQVEDFAGGMVTGNTETRIVVTYDDAGNSYDFVVDDMNQTSGDIDHDATTNFLAAEHVDWAGASAGTIHASNYVDNDTTYSVGDGGLTTNDFTAADHTKLDGIETGADVTDTANVTSSGALMDSEVTNLAQVKAFDTTDYATSAQGATADAALPKAGGTMTGELVIDDLGIEATATDAITDCSGFSATSGGLFYDDSEGKWKKCEDNVLSDLSAGGGGASQLTDLSDVGTAAVTNRNVMIADGTDYDGRALTIADISDASSNGAIGVSAYVNTSEALAVNVAETIVDWTELYDVGGDFNATTGVFTAPVAGKYIHCAVLAHSGVADNDRIRTTLTATSQADHYNQKLASSTVANSVDTCTVRDLSAGDELTVTALNVDTASTVMSAEQLSRVFISPMGGTWQLPTSYSDVDIYAYLTSNEAVAAGVVEAFDGLTEVRDVGGDFNPTTGVFTAPTAGKYVVNYQLTFDVNADQDRLRLYLKKNGTTEMLKYNVAGGTVFNSVSLTRTMDLAAGDTLSLDMENVDSADTVYGTSGTARSIVEIRSAVGTMVDTMTTDVGVAAYLTSNEATVAATPEYLDTFTENFDLGDDFNASTGVFTAPIAGKYIVQFQSAWMVTAASDLIATSIHINDVNTGQAGIEYGYPSNGQTTYISKIYDLSASDTVKFQVNNANSNDTVISGDIYTWVSIMPVGNGVVVNNLIDEDDMTSNTTAQAPTQQSVKAYVDAAGGGNLTTKGDLEVHNGTSQTRLAVGTDDQVLKADSSAAAGVAWADLYGGVGFMKRSSTSTSAIGLGTALTLDTAVTDTTGGDVTWSAGNASRLTIATAGTYEICGYVTITDGSTQRQSSTLKIYKNGTAVTDARGTAYIRNYGLSWDWWVLELACTPFVAAVNDYFEVYAGENASTTLAWANNGAPTFVGSESEIWIKRLDAVSGFAATPLDQVFVIPSSDEGTDLTTGTDKIKFRMPYSVTISEVRASMGTAPTGSVATFDINENGTSILSTKLSIDATEKTSTTAAVAAVISDSTLAGDSEITVDIDAIGSTTAGKGLKIYLIVE